MSDGEKQYNGYAEKAPTDLHEHLAEWIQDKTGYDPSTAKNKDQAFLKGVQLGALLRMDHQASPENQERRRSLSERTKAAREQAAKEKADAKAAKKAAAATTEATPAAAGTAEATPAEGKAAKRQRGPKAAEETATAAF